MMRDFKRFGWFFLIVTILSVITHHLMSEEYFPLSPDYEFPALNIIVSVVLTVTLFLSIDFMYDRFFKGRGRSFAVFILTCEFLVFAIYAIGNSLLGFYMGAPFMLLPFIQGLLISMLSCTLWLVIDYTKVFIPLGAAKQTSQKIVIDSGVQTRIISIANIAFFFIENQIVYTVLKDGKRFTANAKLSELEEKLSGHPFFRVNRQFLVSQDAVQSVKKDINQKLLVTVEPMEYVAEPLTVSRYKYKDFQNWISAEGETDHSGF